MPPKKKEAAGVATEDEPNEEEKELMERELVISYLKTRLGRYQEQGDRLLLENLKLTDELEISKSNLKEINEFLTNELKARALTSAALEQKLQDTQAASQQEISDLKKKIRQLEMEMETERAINEEKEIENNKKRRVYMQFLEQKEEMEQEIQTLRKQVEDLTVEMEDKMSNAERQFMQEKDRWKKETEMKIKETKTYMMKLTDNQLEQTTKRTIMENEQMTGELAFQSRQTENLLKKNQELIEQNASQKKLLELSRQTQDELAKRNFVYQKTMKMLLEKMKTSGAKQSLDNNTINDLNKQLEQFQDQRHFQSLVDEEKDCVINELQEKLNNELRKQSELQKQYDEAAQFLVKCLEDVKKKVVSVIKEESNPKQVQISGSLNELSPHQRERALTYILKKFHVFQAEHGEPSPVVRTPSPVKKPTRSPLRTPITPISHANMMLRGLNPLLLPGQKPKPTPEADKNFRTSAVQTQDDSVPDEEQLLSTVLSEMRPWGGKAEAVSYVC